MPVREAVAAFADLPVSSLAHVLLTKYRSGAAIGWHKDRSAFGEIVGVLPSAAAFRMRCKSGRGWRRAWLQLQPRSATFRAGRREANGNHSIPAVEHLRYSITFRTLIEPAAVR